MEIYNKDGKEVEVYGSPVQQGGVPDLICWDCVDGKVLIWEVKPFDTRVDVEGSTAKFAKVWGKDVEAGGDLGLPQEGYTSVLQQRVTVSNSDTPGLQWYVADDPNTWQTAVAVAKQIKNLVTTAFRKKPTKPTPLPKKSEADSKENRPVNAAAARTSRGGRTDDAYYQCGITCNSSTKRPYYVITHYTEDNTSQYQWLSYGVGAAACLVFIEVCAPVLAVGAVGASVEYGSAA